MADVMTVKERSRLMSRVRSKDTSPEMRLRRTVWAKGGRYRLRERLPGKPDLVFPKAKLAVFVDGCFWHQCPEHGTMPETNVDFWAEKLQSNVDRDRRVNDELRSLGWVVMRFWEHEIKKDVESCAELILERRNSLLR